MRFETLEFPKIKKKKKNAFRRATSFFNLFFTKRTKIFKSIHEFSFYIRKERYHRSKSVRLIEKKKKGKKKKENVGSSNFWGELEAVWATRRPAMAEHRAEGSLPPLPARSFHRADRPRDWVGSWVRHNPRWAGRRTSATFDRTPASRGIAAIAGIHLDIASNDCTICPKERSRSRRRCTVLSNEKKS